MSPKDEALWYASTVVSACLLLGPGAIGSSIASAGSDSAARAIDFEQRVEAQRAIEEVYWRHRIWPEENPEPKPPLAEVVPDSVIRAKVEDYLRKSDALETWWGRPIVAAQLQAELERMARDTRNPELLRDLQAALGDDAFLMAETVARSTLADRLIREAYAVDDRFHGAPRRELEQLLANVRDVSELRALGREYLERRLLRRSPEQDRGATPPEAGTVELSAEEWDAWTADLARRFGTTWEDVPLQRMSLLQEEPDRHFVLAVRSLAPDEAVVAVAIWPKRSFDDWWAEERPRTSVEVLPPAGSYVMPTPRGSCEDDTWRTSYFVPLAAIEFRRRVDRNGDDRLGGWTNYVPLNSGGRYDPATDSWTATSIGAGDDRLGRLRQPGPRLNTGGATTPRPTAGRATSTRAGVRRTPRGPATRRSGPGRR